MKKSYLYGFGDALSAICVNNNRKKTLKNYHNELKNFAASTGYAATSSNQKGDLLRAFVMLDAATLQENKWKGYKNVKQSNYISIFNAQILDYSEEKVTCWEECASYPGLQFQIERPKTIKCEWNDQALNSKSTILEGFRSRVFQHEYQHMNGKDFLRQNLTIKITDKQLQHYQEQINELNTKYKKSLEQDPSDKNYWDNIHFKKLKRVIVYSIIDKFKH